MLQDIFHRHADIWQHASEAAAVAADVVRPVGGRIPAYSHRAHQGPPALHSVLALEALPAQALLVVAQGAVADIEYEVGVQQASGRVVGLP